MSMVKVIPPGAQDFSEPAAQQIKISSRGLIGSDRDALIKRAGRDFVEQWMSRVKFAADEIPVHLIAMGATEDYGPNRNGDGFTRETCRKHHGTFEKFAKFYRDHKNRDPQKSYGVVKLAAYNEAMKRVELICALNGSEAAARRNNGLLADKEMEQLEKNAEIGVSMACKIPFDVCSACGNKARTRAEYCDAIENGGRCKAGGLKHNLGRVLADGHVLHADNPDPTFFDISNVFRPADRIAYISGRLKAAAAGVVSGAELAEQLGLATPMWLGLENRDNVKLASQLAALEQLVAAEAAAPEPGPFVLATSPDIQPGINFKPVDNVKLAEVLGALSSANVVLSVSDFLHLTLKSASTETVQAVTAALPGAFAKLSSAPDLLELLTDNAYYATGPIGEKTRYWAEKIAVTHNIQPQAVEKRAYLAAIRSARPAKFVMEKVASMNPAAVGLARQYALYKLAACATLQQKNLFCGLTARHCVLQNYVT